MSIHQPIALMVILALSIVSGCASRISRSPTFYGDGDVENLYGCPRYEKIRQSGRAFAMFRVRIDEVIESGPDRFFFIHEPEGNGTYSAIAFRVDTNIGIQESVKAKAWLVRCPTDWIEMCQLSEDGGPSFSQRMKFFDECIRSGFSNNGIFELSGDVTTTWSADGSLVSVSVDLVSVDEVTPFYGYMETWVRVFDEWEKDVTLGEEIEDARNALINCLNMTSRDLTRFRINATFDRKRIYSWR